MQLKLAVLIACACSLVPSSARAQESLWTFSAGPILLRRDNPDHTPLFVDDDGTPVCFASDFNFDYEFGLDVQIRRFIDENVTVQARYFGVNDWDATKQVTSFNGLHIATQMPSGITFSQADASAVYGSSLHSTEINLLHPYNDWLNFVAGFRWIELGETINATITSPGPQGTFYNNVDNHLYGAQIGAEAIIWASEQGWTVDGFAKAGLYGNSADHDAMYTGGAPVYTWWNHASGTAASFVGEVGLTCSLSLLDWLTVRFGYEALWISNVALASNQIPITPTTLHQGAITTGDSVFYHGGLLQILIIL